MTKSRWCLSPLQTLPLPSPQLTLKRTTLHHEPRPKGDSFMYNRQCPTRKHSYLGLLSVMTLKGRTYDFLRTHIRTIYREPYDRFTQTSKWRKQTPGIPRRTESRKLDDRCFTCPSFAPERTLNLGRTKNPPKTGYLTHFKC